MPKCYSEQLSRVPYDNLEYKLSGTLYRRIDTGISKAALRTA